MRPEAAALQVCSRSLPGRQREDFEACASNKRVQGMRAHPPPRKKDAPDVSLAGNPSLTRHEQGSSENPRAKDERTLRKLRA